MSVPRDFNYLNQVNRNVTGEHIYSANDLLYLSRPFPRNFGLQAVKEFFFRAFDPVADSLETLAFRLAAVI